MRGHNSFPLQAVYVWELGHTFAFAWRSKQLGSRCSAQVWFVPGRNLVGLAFSLAMAFIILVTIRVGWIRMGKTECFAAGESYLLEFPKV